MYLTENNSAQFWIGILYWCLIS